MGDGSRIMERMWLSSRGRASSLELNESGVASFTDMKGETGASVAGSHGTGHKSEGVLHDGLRHRL